MPNLPDLTREQDQALRDAIGNYVDSPIVTDYVIVAKSIDTGGEPRLSIVTSPDTAEWDQIGMLRCVLAVAEHAFATTFNNDGGDE